MPLTEKGKKIKSAMVKKYGPEKGEQVFYASKNKGTITGVDNLTVSNSKWKLDIAIPKGRSDDNQHMGFTGAGVEPVKKLVSECDALAKRLDAFEKRKAQPQPPKPLKPKTKDNMQPSNPHPKEV